ncbi:MAG: 16S rRNA (guanine527-N7)-methyltransferase [Flavobacteriales bacterium]
MQFAALGELYEEWNSQINVISRKNIDELYTQHVLHSLAIAKAMNMVDGSKVLDIGTGGGFPGIPLAILYPEVNFTLVDSIGKKIKVVQAVVHSLDLENVTALHARGEEIKGKFDFVVSRAVTRLANFIPWTYNKFEKKQKNAFPNGILYLKGGDLKEEISEVKKDVELIPISKMFDDPFFETKFVVYVKMV